MPIRIIAYQVEFRYNFTYTDTEYRISSRIPMG